ncbi:hypothetical protein ACQP2Y_27595 [Actinoplanes sp. CA-051413]|uniref:hypothetical protein n=1 Tax=Actinoplanes sp. CA-051413 TaxID=3239899 RepID=UPI003D996414
MSPRNDPPQRPSSGFSDDEDWDFETGGDFGSVGEIIVAVRNCVTATTRTHSDLERYAQRLKRVAARLAAIRGRSNNELLAETERRIDEAANIVRRACLEARQAEASGQLYISRLQHRR